MIPQTAGTLAAFLALVAPGLLFDLLRARRRETSTETTFREISRTGLSSLVFTVSSIVILFAISRVSVRFPISFDLWISEGNKYIQSNAFLACLSVIAELIVAFSLAVLTHFVLVLLHREKGSLTPGSLWYESLREDAPAGTVPWVHVKLVDGTSFYGLLRSYFIGAKVDEREISLEGVGLTQVQPPDGADGEVKKTQIGKKWEVVIVRAAQISYLRIYHMSIATGEAVSSKRRMRAMIRDGLLHKELPSKPAAWWNIVRNRKTSHNHSKEVSSLDAAQECKIVDPVQVAKPAENRSLPSPRSS